MIDPWNAMPLPLQLCDQVSAWLNELHGEADHPSAVADVDPDAERLR